jgi:hypothetical protein
MSEPVLTTANPIYHEATEGGIRYSPASAHSKEMAKWEMRALPDGSVTQNMIESAKRNGVHQGAFEHLEYPKAMLRYEQTPTGIKIAENRSAQSETEERNLLSRGFRTRADEAMAVVEQANFEAAEAAANRAFHDRRMSESARREADAADLSTARHLGEIPAEKLPPKRKRRTQAEIAADAAKG